MTRNGESPIAIDSGGRPASESGRARIAEIRHAALELFAVHGYEATTMTDIGNAVGLRGPSLYKHIASKQELLVQIMAQTMDDLLATHAAAVATTGDVAEQLRRATETHVRYHARHRLEAYIGTREIRSLVEPHRRNVLSMRSDYEARFRDLISSGIESGVFTCDSAQLASYAILDLGMGVSVWFREGGQLSEDEIVWHYGELAMRIVGADPRRRK